MKPANYILHTDNPHCNSLRDSFECPHCNTFTSQINIPLPNEVQSKYTAYLIFSCFKCQEKHIYTATIDADGSRQIYDPYIIYPDNLVPLDIPIVNNDLTEEIKNDYNEAALLVEISPRSAAALLRLCIQKLCINLGYSKNINKAVGQLYKGGLEQNIIDALDIVRVVGNEAVHPGQMDIKDNQETVKSLFILINLIANHMITVPKKIQELRASLPINKLEGIDERDGKN